MKNIIITGSANGMGFETSKRFKELGHNVIAIDIIKDNENVRILKELNIDYHCLD